ncbi:MAG: B12-binding domain-containing radical SAM protein [Lachnospiraceae bacterium]|nr:B12-binding domain-containing radical SAM protein [Lachnospiraceae bacterium]
MNIVLMAMNAKYIHSNLAVYSLQSYAGKQGSETKLKEFTINQQEDEILRDLVKERPDVLAVSVYIWNVDQICNLLTDFHKVLPKTEIWLGGPEVSYRAAEFLEEYPFVKGILRGEGEKTFAELCRCWKKDPEKTRTEKGDRADDDYSCIRGISYRDQQGVIRENPDQLPLSMDELVFPYEDLDRLAHRILYYETSRGCPFRCSYCLSSVEKTLRFRSWELVQRELQFFLDHKVPQVKFIDRTFNCKKEHTMQIWEYLRDHDNGITNFHFEIGADLLDEEEIRLLSGLRPGFFQLEIGVQTTCPETLKEIRRMADFSVLSGNVKAVMAAGNVHQHLDLIAGLPFEGYERFKTSFNDVYALRPEQLQLGFLKVLRGSYMYEMAEEYGIVWKKKQPYEVLATRWLSYQEILDLKLVEEMVEVYYNSGQFSNTVREMEELFPDAFSLYESLGKFYEAKGYLQMSHTRFRRYEILREYLQERGVEEKEELRFRNAMICDLYLRENCKSRPVWAEDLSRWKDRNRAFFQKEAEEHRFLPDYDRYDWKQIRSMTHLELLRDPASSDGHEKYTVLLFDYKTRNPLDASARIMDVTDAFFYIGGYDEQA